MTAGHAVAVRRRFLVLSATRWLPTGLLIPVIVVLAQERGLSLAAIGLLWGLQGLVVLVLELPTGGLADAVGRRPVLIVASVVSLLSTVVLMVAGTVPAFAVALALDGIHRALESGPLESWYVDAAQLADADADIERGLAQRGIVLGVALASGSLLGGLLALAPQPDVLPALALPVLGSAVLRAADVVAVAVLLREVGPARSRAAGRLQAAWASVGRTRAVVADAVGVMRGSAALLALAAVELLWGAGMSGVELLAAPRMVDLLGDTQGGVFAFAVAGAVAWSISGAGAGVAPWLARRSGSWVNAAVVTRVAQGVGVAAAAVVAGPAGLLIGYLGFYLVHGAANVAHYGLVHRNVTAAHRATVVSANSLTSRLGGVISGPLLGWLATAVSIPAAFGVSALLLVVPAPLYLLARPPRDRDVPLDVGAGVV